MFRMKTQFAAFCLLLSMISRGMAQNETPTPATTTKAPRETSAKYALRDGDTVVFLGDSITAARTYGKLIENYTLLRFPDRKIRFINAGRGGDTAAGGLSRLERDVFSRKPTVLIVAYGVNDILWGVKADEEHQNKYLAGIEGIVKECQQRGVRGFYLLRGHHGGCSRKE